MRDRRLRVGRRRSGEPVSARTSDEFSSLELEGWEVVVEPDRHGMPTRYHVVTRPENLVYMKTRELPTGPTSELERDIHVSK